MHCLLKTETEEGKKGSLKNKTVKAFNQIVTWNDVYINPSQIPWKVKSHLSFQFIKIKRIRDSLGLVCLK